MGTVKQVFEVFQMAKEGTYGSRMVFGVFTNREVAKAYAKSIGPNVKFGQVHVVLIEGVWHRYYVRPLVLDKELDICPQTNKTLTSVNFPSESS